MSTVQKLPIDLGTQQMTNPREIRLSIEYTATGYETARDNMQYHAKQLARWRREKRAARRDLDRLLVELAEAERDQVAHS